MNFLYLIIPVFNEAPNVGRLIQTLVPIAEKVRKEFSVFVVFVDDGSIDGTADEILSNANAVQHVLLRHEENLGPGNAFAAAFEYLSERLKEDDWVVTMEGDNTSPAETLYHMLLRRREGYDVVLASPYLYGGGIFRVKTHRLFLSHVANGLVKILLGIRGIQTFSCFFRLHSGRIVLALQAKYGQRIIKSQGFECMVEMLAKLIKIKARISEVEMTLDWNVRAGDTKMNIPKTIWGYFRLFAAGSRIFQK
jgi:dolichol-phosphate mannosyltransferase